MFATKKYKETKAKKFSSDKERKKYFSIKNYYTRKEENNNVATKKIKMKINKKDA